MNIALQPVMEVHTVFLELPWTFKNNTLKDDKPRVRADPPSPGRNPGLNCTFHASVVVMIVSSIKYEPFLSNTIKLSFRIRN